MLLPKRAAACVARKAAVSHIKRKLRQRRDSGEAIYVDFELQEAAVASTGYEGKARRELPEPQTLDEMLNDGFQLTRAACQ